MNNVFYKNRFCTGAVQIHAEPYLIPLIQSMLDLKMERNYVKIKLHRNPDLEKPDIYEFIMDLFDNGDP